MRQEQSKDMNAHFYRASAEDFMKIPGSPVAYWLRTETAKTFDQPILSKLILTEGQNKTANNDRFVRLFWEVSIKALGRGLKWIPYAKGGEYRKWYGNIQHVVDWSDDSRSHYRKDHSCRIVSEEFWYKEGITWTDITSGGASFRYLPEGGTFDMSGPTAFLHDEEALYQTLALLNSGYTKYLLPILNPTLHAQLRDIKSIPQLNTARKTTRCLEISKECVELSKNDWATRETSLDFRTHFFVAHHHPERQLKSTYKLLLNGWNEMSLRLHDLEESNNRLFIEAYGLQDELTPDVPLEEITLTCNPHYRYGGNRSEEELKTLLQCDTIKELVSYAIGCLMGRYSLDKPGLILASQGETMHDYLRQIPSPRFAPDGDGILPLSDQEWFADDTTNRFREFVRVAWGEERRAENLDFVAESLCLHAIKPKRGESGLDTIRRYLSTQFFKDHLRTYQKRPIYWLFSSGKHKAFECLVYLHRYHEGTLARMRTEYVIPLSGKLNAYVERLEKDKDNSSSAAETKALEKQIDTLHRQQAELAAFDEKLRHYADQCIKLDLDDGVKVNYGRFGDLLADVKTVCGDKVDD